MKQAKLITPLNIAKVLGVEKEYKSILIDESLKTTYNYFMNSDFENEKNNTDLNININEKNSK